MTDAPERIAVKKTNGYETNWYGVVTDIYDERGVEYIRADLANAQVMALVDAVRRQADALCILSAGLEPKRQEEIEKGDIPATHGEKIWACAMLLRRALRDLKGEDYESK